MVSASTAIDGRGDIEGGGAGKGRAATREGAWDGVLRDF
jgi:hypothetical protein